MVTVSRSANIAVVLAAVPTFVWLVSYWVAGPFVITEDNAIPAAASMMLVATVGVAGVVVGMRALGHIDDTRKRVRPIAFVAIVGGLLGAAWWFVLAAVLLLLRALASGLDNMTF